MDVAGVRCLDPIHHELLMGLNLRPIFGAYLTLAVLYLVGVLSFYGPIAAQDVPGDPLVPRLVGFLVAIAVYMALFVWIEQEMGNPFKAAMAVALSWPAPLKVTMPKFESPQPMAKSPLASYFLTTMSRSPLRLVIPTKRLFDASSAIASAKSSDPPS